ncbi:MAG TPA: hypothetical protein PLS51_13515 [Flavobacterium sp.]|nr:hypothetical protein [Flavobacterium sp.]
MKRQIIILILLCNLFITHGQEKCIYEFEKIEAVNTIQKKETIENLLSNAELFDNKYFINFYNNERTPTFFIKEKDYCISLNIDFSDEAKYNIVGLSQNGQFIYINGEGNHLARQTEFGYKYLYIINLKNKTYLPIQYFSSVVFWEPNDNGFNITKEHTVNSSKIAFNKDGFTVTNYIFSITNDEKIDYDVIQSGVYELDDVKLKKTKSYNAKLMQFIPIKFVGNIAIGMTLEDLKLIYPDVSFIEKQNIYQNCAEENSLGFEVWDGNELLGYVNNALSENRISNFIALSSVFNFGKLSTNSTAREILKWYPKSNVRLDLITDWEHIYVKELNIELVFKTNETNRIGKYKNENFIKLRKGEAKVDFIQVN